MPIRPFVETTMAILSALPLMLRSAILGSLNSLVAG